MSFYQSIADYYDFIFPSNQSQIDFVKETIPDPKNKSVLDIGCGTGNLDIALAKFFKTVAAIDSEESMVEKAKRKTGSSESNLQFLQMNMLEIETKFKKRMFDTIICFGNTLVHLESQEEIGYFIRQAINVLKPGGKILLQVINYDRILNKHIVGLPTIENEHIIFVRDYHYKADHNKILFKTLLTDKKNKQEIRNNIPLYPIRKVEISNLLEKANFSNIQFYSNFKRDKHFDDSIPLVVEATS